MFIKSLLCTLHLVMLMRTSKLFILWFVSGYLLTFNILQIAEYNAHGVDPVKLDKRQLLTFLQGEWYKNVCVNSLSLCVCVVGVLSQMTTPFFNL